jgi:hypothetical protein
MMNAHNFFDIRALTCAVGRAVLSAPGLEHAQGMGRDAWHGSPAR